MKNLHRIGSAHFPPPTPPLDSSVFPPYLWMSRLGHPDEGKLVEPRLPGLERPTTNGLTEGSSFSTRLVIHEPFRDMGSEKSNTKEKKEAFPIAP